MSPPLKSGGTREAADPRRVLGDTLATLQNMERITADLYRQTLATQRDPYTDPINDPQHAAFVGVENLALDLSDLYTKISTIRIHTELRVARAGVAP